MFILLTYDINTETAEGRKRLHKIATTCERYGSRVQASIFELLISPAELESLKIELAKQINKETDSIRLYRLGKNYKPKISILGKTTKIEAGEPLIL